MQSQCPGGPAMEALLTFTHSPPFPSYGAQPSSEFHRANFVCDCDIIGGPLPMASPTSIL